MTHGWIIGVDQSTSGTKVVLADEEGRLVAKKAREHQQYYPQSGWVEQDPWELYRNTKELIADVGSLVEHGQIRSVAITNQRETVIVWDKKTGDPIYNAIVWQCRRSADICDRLKTEGYESTIKEKTGLTLDPYFSATKVMWILDNVPGARSKAERGELALGTVDSWLIWNLTGMKVHATDYTNASRTMLFNIHSLGWDPDLLKLFGIPESMLPTIQSSNDEFGFASEAGSSFSSVPICGVMGDSQAALFGQRCFEEGMAKITYGTGSSVLMHTGKQPVAGAGGLVTSVAWGISGSVEYVVEGIIHSTGDTVKWVRDSLGLFSDFNEADTLINSTTGNDGVYLVPGFVGLGAPYWDPYARAGIVGLSRGSNKAHIVRAALESIAYQVRDVIDLMRSESNLSIKELRVDGGASTNTFLMQFQADVLNVKISRTNAAELSVIGVIYMSGLGIGLFNGKNDILKLHGETQTFEPESDTAEMETLYSGWKEAVHMILSHGRT